MRNLNIWIRLFFNVVLWVVLYFLWLPQFPTPYVPCVIPQASAASLGTICIVIFHLFLQTFGPLVGRINIRFAVVAFDDIIDLIKNLLLWSKSDTLSWGIALLLIAVSVYVGHTSLSPFSIKNPPPNILDFSITNTDETIIRTRAGDSIDIVQNEIIFVEAMVADKIDTVCEWMATSGTLANGDGCATRYSPQTGIDRASLTVLAKTVCSESMTFSGFSINIIQTQP